jgi:hypothetical protein
MMGAFNVGQSASYFEAFSVGRGSAAVIYSVIDRYNCKVLQIKSAMRLEY